MEEKSCFNCANHDLCFLKRDLVKATQDCGFLNIDNPDHSGKWADIFNAVGKSCLKYKYS